MSAVSFQCAVQGLPEFAWAVKITAACPNCSSPIEIGGEMQGGGSTLKCTECKYHSIYPGVTPNALKQALLEQAARHCG